MKIARRSCPSRARARARESSLPFTRRPKITSSAGIDSRHADEKKIFRHREITKSVGVSDARFRSFSCADGRARSSLARRGVSSRATALSAIPGARTCVRTYVLTVERQGLDISYNKL